MLDTDFIRGRASHYRHLARGTEDRKTVELLLILAEVCDVEANSLEEGLRAPRRRSGPA